MSDADEQWGKRLKQARQAADLSQKALGIEAGIDEFVASTRINRYERGIHKPDLLTARKLAEVLKLPLAFFYSDTDDEIADLLLNYAQADCEVQQQVRALLNVQQSLAANL